MTDISCGEREFILNVIYVLVNIFIKRSNLLDMTKNSFSVLFTL